MGALHIKLHSFIAIAQYLTGLAWVFDYGDSHGLDTQREKPPYHSHLCKDQGGLYRKSYKMHLDAGEKVRLAKSTLLFRQTQAAWEN